jgi:hypothetical protein
VLKHNCWQQGTEAAQYSFSQTSVTHGSDTSAGWLRLAAACGMVQLCHCGVDTRTQHSYNSLWVYWQQTEHVGCTAAEQDRAMHMHSAHKTAHKHSHQFQAHHATCDNPALCSCLENTSFMTATEQQGVSKCRHAPGQNIKNITQPLRGSSHLAVPLVLAVARACQAHHAPTYNLLHASVCVCMWGMRLRPTLATQPTPLKQQACAAAR